MTAQLHVRPKDNGFFSRIAISGFLALKQHGNESWNIMGVSRTRGSVQMVVNGLQDSKHTPPNILNTLGLVQVNMRKRKHTIPQYDHSHYSQQQACGDSYMYGDHVEGEMLSSWEVALRFTWHKTLMHEGLPLGWIHLKATVTSTGKYAKVIWQICGHFHKFCTWLILARALGPCNLSYDAVWWWWWWWWWWWHCIL
jgi:hypothetical protein